MRAVKRLRDVVPVLPIAQEESRGLVYVHTRNKQGRRHIDPGMDNAHWIRAGMII